MGNVHDTPFIILKILRNLPEVVASEPQNLSIPSKLSNCFLLQVCILGIHISVYLYLQRVYIAVVVF